MPDARVPEDGTWRIGYSYLKPYSAFWSSVALFPWLEINGAYTRIAGVPGFPGTQYSDSYGSFKDKSAGLKVRLIDEREWFPAVSIGVQDVHGTGVFPAQYGVVSKRFGEVDLTLGYGSERIDGVFGGLRYRPAWAKGFALVAEYDAFDYAQDLGSSITGVDQRDKGLAVGLEYRSDWFGIQVNNAHGQVGVNAYLSLPLQQAEFVPKTREPEPYTRVLQRPTLAQWTSDPAWRTRMGRALYDQDFRNVHLGLSNTKMIARLTNVRISLVSRAVGRAARVILLTSPVETTEIEIIYTINDLAFVTYTFGDVRKLQRYFNGMLGRQELAATVTIRYASPHETAEEGALHDMLASFDEPRDFSFFGERDGEFIGMGVDGGGLERLKVGPRLGLYFNDPSGALRYDLELYADYQRMLLPRLFFVGGLSISVLEDVSEVSNPSNSTLPHVRSDIAEYSRERGLKVDRLLLNRYFQPATRVYARASAGLYEEMFGGVGGQVLYFPGSGRWAADLAVDALWQRDFRGYFGFQDYSVVTAIASGYYKVPFLEGVTAIARAGRFLAKDEGVRLELKRRFRSGFEIGFWYTWTNGNDITSPGSPDNPYHDKGVYMVWALNSMLTRDTQATATIAIRPWTRDVGQMVQSPADLYRIFERGIDNVTDQDGLVRFGDLNDDYAKGKSR